MEKDQKYDPEDLESLLMHKRFEELYPEEKDFVLRHLEGPEEYSSMRQTLLFVQKNIHDEGGIQPRPEIKSALMAKFEKEKPVAAWRIWLNGLFAFRMPQLRWAMPVGIAAAVLFGWMYFFDAETPIAKMAERNTSKDKIEKQLRKEEAQSPKAENEELLPAEVSEELESEDIAESDLNAKIVDLEVINDDFESESMAEVETLSDEIYFDLAEKEVASSTRPVAAKDSELLKTRTANSAEMDDISIPEATSGQALASNVSRKNASSESDLFSLFFTAH